MERFKHVTAVRVLGRYVVELEFDGAQRRIIDLEPLLEGPAFEENHPAAPERVSSPGS